MRKAPTVPTRPSPGRWTPLEARRRAAEILRNDGPAALWFKVLGETCYRRILLFERGLDAPLSPAPVAPDLEMGPLRGNETGACQDLRPELSPEEVTSRLASGERCLVARSSQRVLAMVWAVRQTAWIDYLGSAIDLGPDDFYLYEVSVHPDFRGRRIAGALFNYAYENLREAGGRRAIFAVNLDNHAARRALTRHGEREHSLECCVWLFGWRRNFRRGRSGSNRGPDHQDPRGSRYWDTVIHRVTDGPHYMGDLLALLKQRAYRRMLARWATTRPPGPILKTDLFEEASEIDAIFREVPDLGDDGVGIDISPAVVRRARMSGAAPGARFVAADARSLPFASESMAMVFSPSTLDHFADRAELGRSLREIRRVLVPDGVLILTLDNRQNVFDPLLRLVRRLGLLPYYVGRSYSVREMRAELVSSGFSVEATTSLIQHPRLLGVAATRLANRLGWSWWSGLTRRAFLWAERLEDSPIKYFTGCFVAARAVPEVMVPEVMG